MGEIMIDDVVVDTLLNELGNSIGDRLKAALAERKQLGIERYGKPLRFSMKHIGGKDLEEEILDAIVYSRHIGRLDICRELVHIYEYL
jgi:hypothetical protein